MSEKSYAIVYVHLGDNPAQTLIPFSKYAIKNNPDADFYLITDDKERWLDFPGEIIELKERKKSEISHILKKSGYVDKIAGGYWVKTYERLFALESLKSVINPVQEIIHLESDVILQDKRVLERALDVEIIQEIAVPRMSENLGIASILYSKNTSNLLIGLGKLRQLANEYPDVCTDDMKLLGLALNKGKISELPTWESSTSPESEHFLFDGAAVGQYLFGRDPIHTNNVRISGYENPNFPIKLRNLEWKISDNLVYAESNNEKYFFANLHVHSKEVLDLPQNDLERWEAIIAEANGTAARQPSEKIEELIHGRGYTFPVKLEIYFKKTLLPKFRRKS